MSGGKGGWTSAPYLRRSRARSFTGSNSAVAPVVASVVLTFTHTLITSSEKMKSSMKMCLPTAWLVPLLIASPAMALQAWIRPAASRARVVSSPIMFEPVTTAAVAFAAGLVGPSFVAASKDAELKEVKAQLSQKELELKKVREAFGIALVQLEISANTTELALTELLDLTVREQKKRKGEITQIQEQYEEQIRGLQELLGDYNDRMEFQQNSIKRNAQITDSARAESAAYMERANLLYEKYVAASAMIEKLEAELKSNPVAAFFKSLSGGK